MQYLLLIYGNESTKPQRDTAEAKAEFDEYMAFNQLVGDQFVGAAPLQPVSTATTVRVVDGEALVTDGPFAETKEQLGGYYLIDAPDLDRAIELAAAIPGAKRGCVEIRPVIVNLDAVYD